ncbi:MAG: alkaline phosphatase family protein, partial [Candidatus Tumulicola sp.]
MTARSIRSLAFIACVATAACGGGAGTAPPLSGRLMPAAAASPSPIQHIVMIVQENRSVDNLFATFPGVDGATYGYYLKPSGKTYVKTKVNLKERPLNGGLDINHAS